MNIPKHFLDKIESIRDILTAITDAGGVAYLVGGSVRDLVMGAKQVKDIDIEVHKLSVEDFEAILEKFGTVSLIGKQFGVLKLHGMDIDWSLPRKDSKGRKPTVIVDPNLTIEEACCRRDVTMNAMALDLSLTSDVVDIIDARDIIDPYGGVDDLRNKTLRMVDEERFIEDPLRFYRVMQFIGRFEMQPDAALNDVCKKMDLRDVAKGGELARERIYEEIKKLFLRSKKPSLGLRWVKELGRLDELFPELGALVGVAQREDYHPEGDVFEHTMQSLDAAAALPESDDKFLLMLGVLCHDLGKAEKTDKDGHSRGHDVAGVPVTKSLLRRFTRDSFLTQAVCKLTRFHRAPIVLVEQESGLKAYKRLASKLSPELTMQQLYWISWADVRGRNGDGHEPLEKGFGRGDELLTTFLERVDEAQVKTGPEEPVLLGRDLLDRVEPGPKLGELLKKAYKLQIEEGITDKETLKQRVLEN